MYLHVDINAYFATLLQQETPSLRGQPLGIIKDIGRSCIIACSKEAKLFGIQTGSSRAEALARCPQLKLVKADFQLSLSATMKLQTLFAQFSPDFEVFSLDESFIPFAPLQRLYDNPQQLAGQIQEQIKVVLGEWVTCNVGIGRTRFLAKMVGEVSPKGTISSVGGENGTENDAALTTTEQSLLSSTTFSDVCGIGHRLSKRLSHVGITVPYQINFVPQQDLERWFGPWWSVELQKMARGDEPAFLARLTEKEKPMRSISRSITLFSTTKDEGKIRQILYNLCAEITYKARRQGLAGRLVGVSLTGQQHIWSQHVTTRQPINHTSTLFAAVTKLIDQRPRSFPVIRFAVYSSLLETTTLTQLSLLPDWWQRERLETALDAVNDRYGLFTVHSAFLPKKEIIMPEVTGFFGDKQYYLT
jgi:DNA polymerase-4